jgi:Zn-dependent metalloprotease
MKHSMNCAFCSIVPPYLLQKLARSDNPQIRERAVATLNVMDRARSLRTAMSQTINVASAAPTLSKAKVRRVFDCETTSDLTRKLVMQENDATSGDIAVREAYDYAGITWDFFNTVFGRNSIDNRGLTIVSSVHYSENGQGFDNAFWDTKQMIYGDGGELFGRMTQCLDVVAHELMHGITQYASGLPYHGQSGALNESFSDVFGVVIRQWNDKQTDPKTANWLVGDKLMLTGDALRSLKAPGTANPDDPQPAHMKDYVNLPDTPAGDSGGVHYNSGIPNHAFYLAAVAIGKPTWETAAKIWYTALTQRLKGETDFKKCAYETISVARDFFDDATAVKVTQAWIDVGVITHPIGPVKSLGVKSMKVSAGAKKAAKATAAAKKAVSAKRPAKASASKKKPAKT